MVSSQTSLEAYVSIRDELPARQMQVLRALNNLGQATFTMISEHIRMPINSITPRVNELVKKGLVRPAGVVISPYTFKSNILWEATKQ